jgi:hypothetical protein
VLRLAYQPLSRSGLFATGSILARRRTALYIRPGVSAG